MWRTSVSRASQVREVAFSGRRAHIVIIYEEEIAERASVVLAHRDDVMLVLAHRVVVVEIQQRPVLGTKNLEDTFLLLN